MSSDEATVGCTVLETEAQLGGSRLLICKETDSLSNLNILNFLL